MDWEKDEKVSQISLLSKYHFTSSVKRGDNGTDITR